MRGGIGRLCDASSRGSSHDESVSLLHWFFLGILYYDEFARDPRQGNFRMFEGRYLVYR